MGTQGQTEVEAQGQHWSQVGVRGGRSSGQVKVNMAVPPPAGTRG